jgi:hypothetical protein
MEVYVNSSDYINFYIIGGNATGTPTATIKRPGAMDIALIVSYITSTDPNVEIWQAYLPLSETQVQDVFDIYWAAVVGSESTTQINHIEVVTPYVSADDAIARLGWNPYDTNAINYKSYNEVVAAERIARYVIDRYTGKNFGLVSKSIEAYGQQTDSLYLGETIVVFNKLYENGVLVIDRDDPDLKWLYDVEITPTGMALRIVALDVDILEAEWQYVGNISGAFRNGFRYAVDGLYGYAGVPEKVYEATILLINDYLCKDAVWREKYLNHIEVRDWKFTFGPEAFRGTGNLLADQLLQDFVSTNMVVI